MPMFKWAYWNQPRKLRDRPGRWLPKRSAQAPGHIGDRKNLQPGGLLRFERWQKLPIKAWKLYWRRQKPNGTLTAPTEAQRTEP